MHRRGLLVGALATASCTLLPACEPARDSPKVDMNAVGPPLRLLQGAWVLFAHQSVGRDILAGVADLAATAIVPLRIIELRANASPEGGPGIFHVNIGENGAPEGKIAAFVDRLSDARTYDVAMLKLCYADFDEMDAKRSASLLDRYADAIATLNTLQPRLTLVHATVPLRAELAGWRTSLKRIIGRDQYGDTENVIRNRYNSALRRRFAGKPIFDIALIESTLVNGERSRLKRDGDDVFTLAHQYTHDGGHLNEMGRSLAAAVFVTTLAAALAPG